VEGEVFNLGTGRDISVREMIELISKALGVEARVEIDAARRRGNQLEVMQLLSDNSKAANILGWKPSLTLEEGIRRTVDWVKEQKDRFKTHLYNI
jgi:dTDP-glucose 4,6-dehydratase